MEEAPLIEWRGPSCHVLLNPRLHPDERVILERRAGTYALEGHVFLATSGTGGAIKLVALSKAALLASAAAVNRRLEADAGDTWACVLPTFHVGGLGIHARAYLTGSRVVQARWEARGFVELCARNGVTLASMVPTQVVDLLSAQVDPPRSLRAIIVGGGALDPHHYENAQSAGWPVLPSYGMTECCSQVATARRGSPALSLLDHLEARATPEGLLAFRGESLLTGYALENGFVDPKVDGWFVSGDVGSIRDGVVVVEGRQGDFVRIGGESVDVAHLQVVLNKLTTCDAAIVPIPDDRLGHLIALAIAGEDGEVVERFNERVLPFERIRRVIHVREIPRTPLGKIIRSRLVELAG